MIVDAYTLLSAVSGGVAAPAVAIAVSVRRRRAERPCQCRRDRYGGRSRIWKCPRHNPAFAEDNPGDLGDIPGYRIGFARRQYLESEDLEAADFVRMLDELQVQHLEDVKMVQASAAVLGQPSAGVIPSGMSLHTYAEVLRGQPNRFAGLEPLYELGNPEPVACVCEFYYGRKQPGCDPCVKPAYNPLPGEPDESY